MEKKVWLTGQGVINNITSKESMYNVTLQDIQFSVSFVPEFKQTHLRMNRKELILLKKAIEKEIDDE